MSSGWLWTIPKRDKFGIRIENLITIQELVDIEKGLQAELDKIDNQNFISFKTRRNRKLNLTEYYDLVYEYQNDCLIAGIKYNKSYYEDRDLKPSENLFFTINLVPLTTYEQKIDR